MDNQNYSAALTENVKIGSDVLFNQHVIFNGQGKVIIGDFVEFGYHYSPHFYGFHILILAETNNSVIEIGNNTTFSNDVAIRALKKVKIGNHCLIGDRVTIYDSDMHELNPFFRKRSPGKIEEVNIEDNVWIGSGVTILKGVTVGENSIIGAGSVVTKSIPKNSIAIGNPAKILNKENLYSEKDPEVQNLQLRLKDLIKENIELNELNKAKAIIKQYGYLLSRDIEMYSIKSIIFIKEKKYYRAEEVLKEGIELDNMNFDMLYNLAYIYEMKNEKKLANSFYLKAIEVCNDDSLKNELKFHIETLMMNL